MWLILSCSRCYGARTSGRGGDTARRADVGFAAFARAHKVMFALMPAAHGLLGVRRRLGRAPQWKYLILGPVLLARVLAGDHALLRV